MEIPRPSPPRAAPEREMLAAWLDFHRITLERKCSGLSPAQLRQAGDPALVVVAPRTRTAHGRGRTQLVPTRAGP